MKIGTLNIDWANKARSRYHYLNIEEYLNSESFDFLILTEAINLNLKNFAFKYLSEQIPENVVYENLNYTKYLNGEKAFRTVIYSNIAATKQLFTIDKKTSIALEFKTEFGYVVIYATIIGTWFNKQPYAQIELENCINDCKAIYETNQNLIIVGDLNTSFLANERKFSINVATTKSLNELITNLDLKNATENIKKNIDHIIIPNALTKNISESTIFVGKDVLSDHQGIFVKLNSHFC